LLSAAELNCATRDTAALPAWLNETALRIWPFAAAPTIVLRLRERDVLVKLRERSGVLVGEICGFEPGGPPLAGVHAGELIVFKPAHIVALRE
jgi:hypothetical protein